MKTKALYLFEPFFKVHYYVMYGASKKDFIDEFKKNAFNGSLDMDDLDLALGYCYEVQSEKGYQLWLWTEKKSLSTLSHEIRHAVDFCMLYKGADDMETSARMTEWLIEGILKK